MPRPLAEIAAAIEVHLRRFAADPKINAVPEGRRLHPYFLPHARRAGRYVAVSYVSFQGVSHLTRDKAAAYLAWLDAGYVGTHWDFERQRARLALAAHGETDHA